MLNNNVRWYSCPCHYFKFGWQLFSLYLVYLQNLYTYTRTGTHTHAHAHTHTHTHTHTHKHTHKHIRTHRHTCTHTHIQMRSTRVLHASEKLSPQVTWTSLGCLWCTQTWWMCRIGIWWGALCILCAQGLVLLWLCLLLVGLLGSLAIALQGCQEGVKVCQGHGWEGAGV